MRNTVHQFKLVFFFARIHLKKKNTTKKRFCVSSPRQTGKALKSLLVPCLSYAQATPFVTFRLSLLQHLSSPVRLWSFAWRSPATLLRPLYPQQLVLKRGLGVQFPTDCQATSWRPRLCAGCKRRANACAWSRKYPYFEIFIVLHGISAAPKICFEILWRVTS